MNNYDPSQTRFYIADAELINLNEISFTDNQNLNNALKEIFESYSATCKTYIYKSYRQILEKYGLIISQTKTNFVKFSETNRALISETEKKQKNLLDHLATLIKHHNYYVKNLLPTLCKSKEQADIDFQKAVIDICSKIPGEITITENTKRKKIKLRKNIEKFLTLSSREILAFSNKKFRLASMNLLAETSEIQLPLEKMWNQIIDNNATEIINYDKEVIDKFNALEQIITDNFESISTYFNRENITILQKICSALSEHKRKIPFTGLNNIDKVLSSQNAQWLKHQEIGLNSLHLFFILQNIQTHLKIHLHFQKATPYINLSDKTKEYFQTSIAAVNNYCEKIISGEKTSFVLPKNQSINELINNLQNDFKSDLTEIKTLTTQLPEKLLIFDNNSLTNYQSLKNEELRIKNVSVSKVLAYLIDTEYITPTNDFFTTFINGTERSFLQVQDKIRFFSFIDNDSNFDDNDFSTLIKEKQQKVLDEQEQLIKIRQNFDTAIERTDFTINNYFGLNGFLIKTDNFRKASKNHSHQKRKNISSRFTSSLRRFFRKNLDLFWYFQSQGLIYVKNLKKNDHNNIHIDNLHNILEQNQIDKTNVNILPQVYLKMFNNKAHHSSDLFVGRENIIKNAQKTINRHLAGYCGGIFIHGKYNSGKSYLSQYIAKDIYPESTVYTITTKPGGSTKIADFELALKKAFNSTDETDTILNSATNNTVIVIDEIELWWEKTPDGLTVISFICELIEKYGQKCFFIINSSSECFKILSKLCHIEQYFLSVFECSAVDATTLEKIILLRHSTIDMDYKLRSRQKTIVKRISKSRFFARLFNNSKGNIGIALNIWTKNIFRYSNNCVSVNLPPKSKLTKQDFITPKWIMPLYQFALHRQMDFEKYCRLSHLNKDLCTQQLNTLKRAGLIIENENIFEINPDMHSYIIEKLTEKGVL